MSRLRYRVRQLPLGGGRVLRVAALSGHLDAASHATFEALLDALLHRGARHLVLDFTHVEYVNSTGIACILRCHEECRRRSGELVLARVSREVGYTLHLLGVTGVVPVLRDAGAAVAYFKAALRQGALDGYFNWLRRRFQRTPRLPLRLRLPFWRRPAARPRDASVLLVLPQADVFTDVLRLRLHDPASGRFTLAHDCREALDRIDALRPDLVILDDRLAGAEDFLSRVKIEKRLSLASVIRLYPAGKAPGPPADFRIWENDYLVEPFEVMKLFRLAETELQRVHRDRGAFLQQVRFQFRSSHANLERAHGLAKELMHQVGLTDDPATALLAALHEAVDNAVQHGNRGDERKTVTVNFLLQPRKVTVQVEDEGEGFDYAAHLAQAAPARAVAAVRARPGRGGLGIALMRKCADQIQYLGRGNVLRIEKSLA